jgi:membrane associated rhomboid family serine protease
MARTSMNDETGKTLERELHELGYIPPDPDEPPPVELWSAVGGVRPWATLALVLSWAAVFLLIAVRGETGDASAYLEWGANATGLTPLDTSWRLLSSTFVHAGFAHLFFNATSMLIFGPAAERIFSRSGLVIAFTAGAIASSWASLAWRAAGPAAGPSLSVGASGAIFSLGGALLAAAFRLRHRLAPGRARALGAALLYLLVQGLVAGITRHGTDNIAHGAGLACGVAIGAALSIHPRLGGWSPGPGSRILGAIGAVLLLVALGLTLTGGLAGHFA